MVAQNSSVVPGTLGWLRTTNDRTALRHLLDHGPLTRQQIVDLTGLSKPTAGQMMTRLEAAGLISERDGPSGKRGPRAKQYIARTEHARGLAVDVDAAGLTAVVVDALGSPYPPVAIPLGRSAKGRSAPEDIARARAEACAVAGVDEAAVRFVCVGVQASVDQRTGNLDLTGELPGWQRTGVAQKVEYELGVRVSVENDVKLAATAEYAARSSTGERDFALLWLGEGVGFALHIDGHVLRGVEGRAGEIGYLPVPHSARSLASRARTLQDLVGGAGVARLARTCGIRNRGFAALTSGGLAGATTQEQSTFLKQLAQRVAVSVVPALALLDPSRIVIGGPTGTLGGSRLADLVRAEVRRMSRWNPDITATSVPDAPVLRGASDRLVETIRQSLFEVVDSLST